MSDPIIHTDGDFTVRRTARGHLEVCREAASGTHAVVVATCGYAGKIGLEWCVGEIARRKALARPGIT